jgi:hypothetical protein
LSADATRASLLVSASDKAGTKTGIGNGAFVEEETAA